MSEAKTPNVTRFKAAVIGKGMIGAAAARHFARQVEGVALIGPDEPPVRANHHDVFGSHYDEGRIYRTLDPNPVWATLAARSIARYAEIEAESGIQFHDEAGFLAVANAGTGTGVETYARTGAALGPLPVRLMEDIHVHQTILSVGGITAKGLFNSNLLLVETERAMMRCADEVVVVADHTKIGRQALAFLCELSAVDTLIVDRGLTPEQAAIIDQADVRVLVAGLTSNGNAEEGFHA